MLTEDRIASLKSIRKLTDYKDLNIYSIDIQYDYDLNRLTPVGVYDNQALMDLQIKEALPGSGITVAAPDFGCSAFTLPTEDGIFLMGRNYDFRSDSSAMIVYCHPEGGYRSIAHAALDNLGANDPFASDTAKAACLATPFCCLDGINECGVGIAVLTLDCEPTRQNTGKPVLCTGMLIRLVLDKASSTKEAIELLSGYDIFSVCGRDYHFLITDASGNSCSVAFNPDSEAREIVVTPTRTITNFFVTHIGEVLPNQKNGIYGHGRERYDAIETVFNANEGVGDTAVAWKALHAAAQTPNPDSVTSNTQWSIAYNLNDLTYEIVLHRNWEDVITIDTLAKACAAE